MALSAVSNLRVLDAAQWIADEVHRLCLAPRSRILHVTQLLKSSQSIPANIGEGWGRRKGPDRNRFLGFALASAEETEEHLRTNYRARRLDAKTYWDLHNRLVTVRKMIEKLMAP